MRSRELSLYYPQKSKKKEEEEDSLSSPAFLLPHTYIESEKEAEEESVPIGRRKKSTEFPARFQRPMSAASAAVSLSCLLRCWGTIALISLAARGLPSCFMSYTLSFSLLFYSSFISLLDVRACVYVHQRRDESAYAIGESDNCDATRYLVWYSRKFRTRQRVSCLLQRFLFKTLPETTRRVALSSGDLFFVRIGAFYWGIM